MKFAQPIIIGWAVSGAHAAYETGQEVPIAMNKLWPYDNPTETYEFYDFPFCHPTEINKRWMTLGQILRGDRLVNSVYNVKFREDAERKDICSVSLDYDDYNRLVNMIDSEYVFEMFVDDLPIQTPVGTTPRTFPECYVGDEDDEFSHAAETSSRCKYMSLVTHLELTLGYNKNNLVHANVTQESVSIGCGFDTATLEHCIDKHQITKETYMPKALMKKIINY